jgi:hypothetical protein
MRRHSFRWFPAAIVLAVTVMAATVWAKTGHLGVPVQCPDVDARGSLSSINATPIIFLTINEKTSAYHGKAHTKVTNLSGHSVTFIDSGFAFGLPGITKSKYTVKANGDATLTLNGVVPPQ